LKLELSDITEDGLLIRATKFQKSRLVPLQESARRGLLQYVAVRNRLMAATSLVFVSRRGTQLPYSTVNATFLRLVRSTGLRGHPGSVVAVYTISAIRSQSALSNGVRETARPSRSTWLH
jgi:site-specific recombinase XerD